LDLNSLSALADAFELFCDEFPFVQFIPKIGIAGGFSISWLDKDPVRLSLNFFKIISD
jgi:hypothetical protein